MSEPLRCDRPAHTDPAHLYNLLISELTDFAVFLTDPEGSMTTWNPGVENLLGYSESEWIGQSLPLIFTPEDRAAGKPEEELIKAVRDGRSPDIRWHQRKDGSRLFVEGTLVALKDSAGQLLGFSKVMRDITQRQCAEEALRASEERFRTLADHIPNLAWMADETGYIFWYNKRWYDYTGKTPAEMEGWGWQTVHDPAVLPSVLELWTGSIAQGKPFEMVFPLRGADAQFQPFLTRVVPVRDTQQRVVRWFGTNTDITEQRKTEEELRRMNRELEEFAYVASHDLQEPLRMVNLYTQKILKSLGKDDPTLNDYAGYVRQGVIRMERLIRDLLTYSHTVQQDELPAGTANLAESLSEALSVLKSRLEDSGAVISVQSLPVVQGDPQQISHVFQNLLSNALKYRKKEAPPEIYISARAEGDHWVVSVRDNGIGFEPQYAERIFGLFKRLHKDEYPGTGVGLAICQRIVERHGGRIWAEGRPGEGATFYFTLSRGTTT